jgi:hypothetical protein
VAFGTFNPPLAWENGDWVTVYARNQNIDDTNWVTFYLDTPFVFNGTNNIVVDISFNNDSYSSDGLCYATESKESRVLSARTDSGFGDPLAWTGAANPPPRASTRIPNMQFLIESAVPATPTVAGPFVQGVWTGMVSVQSPTDQVFIRAVDLDGRAGLGNVFAVETSSGSVPSRIVAINQRPQGTIISFSTVAGAQYVVERTENLALGQWSASAPPLKGSGAVMQVVDSQPPAHAACFYRVCVLP